MRRSKSVLSTTALLAIIVSLSACQKDSESDVNRAIQEVNAIDESNMSDIMLTVADPQEAVAYFSRSVSEQPDRIDLQRNLARSLIRAKQPREAGTRRHRHRFQLPKFPMVKALLFAEADEAQATVQVVQSKVAQFAAVP